MVEDSLDLPPFVRSWSQLYAIVLGSLAAEIVLSYVLMQYLS